MAVMHLAYDGLAGVTVCGRTGVRRVITNKHPWRVTCKQCRARMTPDQRAAMAPMVERTNLLTGAKYMEAEDTPNYCSPASEAYWSM